MPDVSRPRGGPSACDLFSFLQAVETEAVRVRVDAQIVQPRRRRDDDVPRLWTANHADYLYQKFPRRAVGCGDSLAAMFASEPALDI